MKKTYLLLLFSLLFEILADYFFKKWSLSDKNVQLVAGVAGYTVATVFFALCLRDESLTKMVCWFTLVNCIAASLIGIAFGEPLTARIAGGVVLACVSIWLLS